MLPSTQSTAARKALSKIQKQQNENHQISEEYLVRVECAYKSSWGTGSFRIQRPI